MANFASMTQIIFGLQAPWIERLTSVWARVPQWEKRVFKDLKSLASPTKNFRHMRRVMDVMIDEEGLEERVNSVGPPDIFATNTSPGHSMGAESSQKASVPFCGLMLMDLMEVDVLPTTIAGESAKRSIGVDRLRREDLPRQLQHSVLVNIYKMRILSMTVKTVIAFQERARAYSIQADSALYMRCLKLRCLPAGAMTQ